MASSRRRISMTPAFSELLLEGPSSAIEHLRSLYISRGSSILDPQDELVLVISQLSPHFCVRELGLDGDRASIADAMTLLRGEVWRACISCELLILLLEMTNDSLFSAQPQAWIVHVLTCLGGLLSALYLCAELQRQTNAEPGHPLPDQQQLEGMFALFHPTWQNLWAHIDDFLDPRCDVVGSPGLVLGLLVSISGDMQYLCGTVYMHMVASTEAKMRVLLDVDYIPVILFAWTHATLRGGSGNFKLRRVPALMQKYRNSVDEFNDSLALTDGSDVTKVSVSDKFDKAIFHIGSPQVVEAFRLVLDTKDWMVDEYLVEHLQELSVLLSPTLSHCSPLREAFWARPMTDALWAACKREQDHMAHLAHEANWRVHQTWCKLCCDLLG
ncbi:hypothetical protein PENSPDRAFT_416288 [Peniophora sp. CONT]|nr:hypothetical protein PENSPDRAFT_416288 [Peniophora sp. CONT]